MNILKFYFRFKTYEINFFSECVSWAFTGLFITFFTTYSVNKNKHAQLTVYTSSAEFNGISLSVIKLFLLAHFLSSVFKISLFLSLSLSSFYLSPPPLSLSLSLSLSISLFLSNSFSLSSCMSIYLYIYLSIYNLFRYILSLSNFFSTLFHASTYTTFLRNHPIKKPKT